MAANPVDVPAPGQPATAPEGYSANGHALAAPSLTIVIPALNEEEAIDAPIETTPNNATTPSNYATKSNPNNKNNNAADTHGNLTKAETAPPLDGPAMAQARAAKK